MFVANAFMVTYLVMAAITIVNMFVAVILENYTQATEDVQEVREINLCIIYACREIQFIQRFQ